MTAIKHFIQLVLLVSLVQLGNCFCERGWTSMLNGDHCYRFVNSTYYSRNISRSICQELGADLPSIHSLEEQSFLKSLAQRSFWLGIEKVNSYWQWNDGSELTFTDWGSSEPDSYDGYAYVHSSYSSRAWQGVQISSSGYQYSTLCKKPYSPPLVPTIECSPGWVVDPRSGSCYLLVDSKKMKMDSAQEYCNGFSTNETESRLLSITTEREQQLVEIMLASCVSKPEVTLMGLLGDDVLGLKWTDGSDTRATYTNLLPGQPISTSGYCFSCYGIVKDTFKWKKVDCSDRLPFICEQKANP